MVVPQKQTKQIELPYDPEIPLLDIHLKELKSKNRYLYICILYKYYICIAMFISLFTVTNRRTQLKCPLMGGWIN